MPHYLGCATKAHLPTVFGNLEVLDAVSTIATGDRGRHDEVHQVGTTFCCSLLV
jgi:hypothetical protein